MRADEDSVTADALSPDFDRFYREHRGRLERLGHVLTGSRTVGEELAQEALLATSVAWDDLDEPRAFARRVLVNKAASFTRHQVVTRRYLSARRGPTDQPALDYLWDVIVKLRPEPRIAVVLRFYEDLSIDEIAQITDVPPGTVKSRLHRAMSKMRRELR